MKYKKLIKSALVFFSCLVVISNFANTVSPQTPSQTPWDPTSYAQGYGTPTDPQNPNIIDPNPTFNFSNGFLNIGGQYSDLVGFILNTKFSHKLGTWNACAIEFDYGQNENRLNGTWGFALKQNQLFKLTAERLSENLPFSFATGTIDQTIPQYAYGGAYEYLFPNGDKINDINLGAYYANAQSKNLNPIIYAASGGEYIDYRHIAGATSQGCSIGFDAVPWPTGAVGLKLNYDQVKYNQLYNLIDTSENNNGLGVTLNLTQLLTKHLKFTAEGSKREPYDDYQTGLSWLMPFSPANQVELGIVGEHTVSHNSTPNDTRVTLNLALSLASNPDQPHAQYSAPSFAQSNDLLGWTTDPAVHMDLVIATADELVEQVDLVLLSALSPTMGSPEGGTLITLIGNGFIPGVTVTFGGTPAASVSYLSHTMLNAITPTHAAGAVNVTVTNPNGQQATLPLAFTFATTAKPQPVITNLIPNIIQVTPNQGASGMPIVIKGTGFLGTAAVNFGTANPAKFIVKNDTEIDAIVPSEKILSLNKNNTVDIAIATAKGISQQNINDKFTYGKLEPGSGPTVSKTFLTPTIRINTQSSTLRIQLTNTNGAFQGTTGIAFTDNYPAGMINTGSASGNCGGTVMSAVGGTSIALTGGSLGTGSSSCTISIPVTATAPATYTNNTGTVTSNQGNSAGSSANLLAVAGPNVSKAFLPTTINPNGTSTLTVTLTNPNPAQSMTSLSFTDNYPGGMVNNSNVSTTCNGTPGGTVGGTSVSLSGASLAANTSCTVSIDVTSASVGSYANTIPAGGANSVVAGVVSPSTTAANATLTVNAAAPTISGVSPPSGPTAGGTSVTITGTNFEPSDASTAVTFDGTPATSVVVVNSTTITCTTPAHAAGAVNVEVSDTGGNATLTNGFTYAAVPNPTSLSPTEGPSTGGQTVTISGTDLADATDVTFDGVSATITGNTPTSITVTTPAGTQGNVTVAVTTPGGSANVPGGYTYVPSPDPTSLSPTSGPAAGGNSVVINGFDLNNATSVTFDGTPATITANTNNSITVTAPAHAPGNVVVEVSTIGGTANVPGGYTYVAAPTVTTVVPNNGPTVGGTSVVITGTDFIGVTGASAVQFGGTDAASYTVDSATQITAVTPAHTAGAVNVTVTGTGGTGTGTNAYTYIAAPTVTNVNPNLGTTAGGTSVTITGTNFIGVTGASAVQFGGTNAASYTVDSATQITAITPAHAAGAVNVTVTGTGGTGTGVNAFTYQGIPAVTGISPTAGPVTGGTSVTITGTGFLGTTGAAGVKFGTTDATSYVVDSATQITAISPAGAAGTVNITVTTPIGTSATSSADEFTYSNGPSIASVNPISGPLTGGTTVAITGANFINGQTTVNFGATPAASVTFNSSTSLTVVSPAGAAGTVNITATTPAGTSATSPADQFTYQGAPTVTNVNPTAGPSGGGTSVVITGANFIGASGAAAVKFGATDATSYIVDSATQITATAPAGIAGTTVNITVTTPSGTSTTSSADEYSYVGTPTVTTVSPNSGPTAGGTSVTITGTNFIGVNPTGAVKFDGVDATYTVVDAATINATTPAHAAGSVNVTVTGTGGTGTATNAFTFIAAPTPGSLTPTSGPTTGGTPVVISGTNLANASSVTFDGTPGIITANSPTSISVTTPAHAAGNVTVTVTTGGGSANVPGGFNYLMTPAPGSASPNSGPPAGGTVVILSGSGFTGTTAVTFGGIPVTSFVVNNDTSITVTTPAHAVGAVNIVVTNSIGAGTLVNGFTYQIPTPPTPPAPSPSDNSSNGNNNVYIYPAGGVGAIIGGIFAYDYFHHEVVPTFVSVTPYGGSPKGGKFVTLTGTGFQGVKTVLFGDVPATNITVMSDTKIVCIAPAHAAGTVKVSVTNSKGTAVLKEGFTYGAPEPIEIINYKGPVTGGTKVILNGANFTRTKAVTFDGKPAPFTIKNDAEVIAIAPAHAAGLVSIVITGPGGSATLGGFTYLENHPKVTKKTAKKIASHYANRKNNH